MREDLDYLAVAIQHHGVVPPRTLLRLGIGLFVLGIGTYFLPRLGIVLPVSLCNILLFAPLRMRMTLSFRCHASEPYASLV